MNSDKDNFLPNVINFHFTDICNYHCRYCFVDKSQKTVISYNDATKVVDNIFRYFKENEIVNGRINLVGGEPLTYPQLNSLIEYIFQKGIKVSLVTNGYLLSDDFLEKNSSMIDMIGISVDSLSHDTNIAIGRCTPKQSTMSEEVIRKLCEKIKSKRIKLKINVCVSKKNAHEDISDFFKAVKADRMKILQMTVVEGINSDCRDWALSDKEFKKSIEKYVRIGAIEENTDQIDNSYVMINSSGSLVQKINHGYEEVGSLLTDDLSNLLAKSKYDFVNYQLRYRN